MPPLEWVDALMLGVLAASVLIGMWRGLVFELLSLAGWLVAYAASQYLAPRVAVHIPVGSDGSDLRAAASIVVCFLAVLLAWALLARLVRALLHTTALQLPDRLMGGAFGALRALVLLLVVATVVSMTPLADSQAWEASAGRPWLERMLQGLRPLLPAEIVRRLPSA